MASRSTSNEKTAMNILLMLPLRPKGSKNIFYGPDLGLGYLASALRKNLGAEINISMFINRLDLTDDEFGTYLVKGRFDVVAIKFFSTNVSSAARTISQVRKFLPEAKIVIGGPQPTGDPFEILNYISADYAFREESELGFPIFIERLIAHKTNEFGEDVLRDVPGLIWRKGESIICNPPKVVEDLDSLVMPAWDLMDPRDFPFQRDYTFAMNYPMAPFITSRGCPFKCTFCSVGAIKFRERSIANVIEELKVLHEKFGVREFNMIDNCCGYRVEYMINFCKALIDSGLNVPWNGSGGTKVTSITSEMLYWMKKSGCNKIWVGIESGSPRILKKIKKGITLEQVEEKVILANKAKVDVNGFFMLGIPGEMREDVRKTMDFSKRINLQGAIFNIFVPVPGTELYEELKREGKLENLNFDELDQKYYKNNFTECTPEELVRLRVKAYWSFHLRPKIIFGRMRFLAGLLVNPEKLYFWIKYVMWNFFLNGRLW